MSKVVYEWGPPRKSSYSNGSQGCVEVAFSADQALVRLRDTKAVDVGQLVVGRQEFARFVRWSSQH